MAIVVDKIQKRKYIALSCKDLILAYGILKPTISQYAEAAGIGKGTFYEYFSSKDELLFELVNILMNEYNIKKDREMSQLDTTKDKVKCFADFFYTEESSELRILYKMFTGVSLLNSPKKIVDFQTECFEYYNIWLEKIIHEGIDSGELDPVAARLAKGMFATADGMFIASETTHSISDIKKELELYIDTLFDLISYKGGNP